MYDGVSLNGTRGRNRGFSRGTRGTFGVWLYVLDVVSLFHHLDSLDGAVGEVGAAARRRAAVLGAANTRDLPAVIPEMSSGLMSRGVSASCMVAGRSGTPAYSDIAAASAASASVNFFHKQMF